MCAGRGEDDATFSVHLGENEEESGRRTGRERRIPTAAQRRKEWKWSGEEKLVTLLQDFCSRRCHCQEIERWRGRKGKGSELERASKHLLSNPALLRRRVFFGRSDLSPPCPPSTGELPPEIQFRKFLCATVSSPRGPRGRRSQTMDVHAPPCPHSPLGIWHQRNGGDRRTTVTSQDYNVTSRQRTIHICSMWPRIQEK